MSRHAPTEENLTYLATVLRDGELVAVPSETVYGLAADATNSAACRKIFALKRRPFFDPLIVHVEGLSQAKEYAIFNSLAEHLATVFWPGPLTFVLPRTALVPDIVTSGGPTVALRAPQHPVLRALLAKVGRGLAAPSANPFGYISPTTAEHVERSFGRELAHVLDGGPCEIGVESTIVDATSPHRLVVLRHGGVPAEALRQAIADLDPPPRLVVKTAAEEAPTEIQPASAPGMLKRHYSPNKRLRLFAHGELPDPRERPAIAHLAYRRNQISNDANAFSLSSNGDGREAAASLYARLRELDEQDWEAIFAELPPPGDVFSAALTDRLQRAAARE